MTRKWKKEMAKRRYQFPSFLNEVMVFKIIYQFNPFLYRVFFKFKGMSMILLLIFLDDPVQ